MPARLLPLEYPGHFEVRRVSRNSGIRWTHQWVCVTHTLAGEYVGLQEVGDRLWDVYVGPLKLGRMDERLLSTPATSMPVAIAAARGTRRLG